MKMENRVAMNHVSPSSSVPPASTSPPGWCCWRFELLLASAISLALLRVSNRCTSPQACSSCSFNLTTESVSSAMAWSVSIFSSVHFSIFFASLSRNCVMYWTARCNIEPLFFSQPGTILASSLMPSLMVSRRRRSTGRGRLSICYTRARRSCLPSLWLSLRTLCHSSEPTAGLAPLDDSRWLWGGPADPWNPPIP